MRVSRSTAASVACSPLKAKHHAHVAPYVRAPNVDSVPARCNAAATASGRWATAAVVSATRAAASSARCARHSTATSSSTACSVCRATRSNTAGDRRLPISELLIVFNSKVHVLIFEG
ncbi:hypothetical protein L917_14995 [Phytophthora nicotianae]|uniref:Uncharacterized protein n=1 Tax=Phytophthora nicotianae TaxID=4792 RepID=W2KK90_PHYNI|nr:hypothetical protein L917_14995 [Phytophthora nicotianae]